MTSNELAVHEPQQPATYAPPANTSLAEWAQNLQAAHQIGSALCATSFAPTHFRGKPEEAAVAILYGSELGMSPTTALQSLFVIGGKPAMYARPMVALVQGAGHEVWTEDKTDESVTVCGRRRGSDKVIRETWTIQRAQRAGYTSNKKYQTDPQAMLYARAASDVCRQIAADVLSGIGYSVEEMEMSGQVEQRPAVSAKPQGMDAVRQAVAPAEPIDVTDAEVVEDDQPEPPATQAQTRRMHASFNDLGLTERDQRLAYSARVIGREIASSKDMTKAETARVIDALEQDIHDATENESYATEAGEGQ